jgi:hypothetical protein
MTGQGRDRSFWRSPAGVAFAVFLAVAAYSLLAEHRAHFVEGLPYLLLLACIGMHFFMHGGHGGHGGHGRHNGGSERDDRRGDDDAR